MKVTIQYWCENCQTTFSKYGGVPDELDNDSIGHGCAGVSKFSGADGTDLSYVCEECGHITHDDITTMIPAFASQTHGCGEECLPV